MRPQRDCCHRGLRRWPSCHRMKGTRSNPVQLCPLHPSRTACRPAGSSLLRFSSKPTRRRRHHCRLPLRRWPCCRRLRGTRKSLGWRSPSRPGRAVWVPRSSLLRFSSRSTRHQRQRCRFALRRSPCCRQQIATRKCLVVERPPRRSSQSVWVPASRLHRSLSRSTLRRRHCCRLTLR